MTIKEARELVGLSISQVSKRFDIPYRSLQNWESGVRECPSYVNDLIVNGILADLKKAVVMIDSNTVTISTRSVESDGLGFSEQTSYPIINKRVSIEAIRALSELYADGFTITII